MAKPDIILIGGHAYRWQEICDLRRQQLEAWKAAQFRQLALFELKEDCRPAAERSAAGRYAEPTLFAEMPIEAQLEQLAEVSERCRKIILVSKAAIAGGVALLLFMMLGLFGPNQVAAIGSIAVVLGGIVSLGSNVSTLRQTMAAMSAAEALRSDLISRIDFRVVSDRTMKRI
jgi:hypothetical protein